MTKQEKIKKYNDLFRNTFLTGKVVFSHGVAAMDEEERSQLITAVRTFEDFSEENDPYGEHDFGAVTVNEQKYFWKIDYYAKGSNYSYGSEEPENPQNTDRLLTIMLASEY